MFVVGSVFFFPYHYQIITISDRVVIGDFATMEKKTGIFRLWEHMMYPWRPARGDER